jgi:hypothetical protein
MVIQEESGESRERGSQSQHFLDPEESVGVQSNARIMTNFNHSNFNQMTYSPPNHSPGIDNEDIHDTDQDDQEEQRANLISNFKLEQ